MIKYCETCKENKREQCPSGYSYWWKDDTKICPYDNNQLKEIVFDADDLSLICEISEDSNFIEAMIKLKQDDIIEYNLKMSQFKATQNKSSAAEESSAQIKCPTCSSTNISRISTTAKVANIAMFGLLGQKRKHQFKCNNCKYEW